MGRDNKQQGRGLQPQAGPSALAQRIALLPPQGYLEMLGLMSGATLVLTILIRPHGLFGREDIQRI